MKQREMEILLQPVPKSIYLAGPFFNAFNLRVIEKVETLCEDTGIKCNSPRKFLVLKPKASWEERKAVFLDNITKIQQSAVVLACLDNADDAANPRPPDTGTIWEMGYAHALGIPVVAFRAEEGPINVMLAQGCDGFLKNLGDVRAFLEGNQWPSSEWDFAWDVAEAWRKDIF